VSNNDRTLVQFDSVIPRLDKFEKLRYLDPNSKGMESMFDITKAGAAAVDAMTASAPVGSVPASTLPQYRFILEETPPRCPETAPTVSLDGDATYVLFLLSGLSVS
jgi:hypothetical protein